MREHTDRGERRAGVNSTNPVAMPVLTGLDAATQSLAALCYLAIGTAALLRAPRDIRTQVFFVFSLANVAAFAIPALMWWKGITDPTSTPRIATALVVAGLGIAALLLFHFTVFPRRRPRSARPAIQMATRCTLIRLSDRRPGRVRSVQPGGHRLCLHPRLHHLRLPARPARHGAADHRDRVAGQELSRGPDSPTSRRYRVQ